MQLLENGILKLLRENGQKKKTIQKKN